MSDEPPPAENGDRADEGDAAGTPSAQGKRWWEGERGFDFEAKQAQGASAPRARPWRRSRRACPRDRSSHARPRVRALPIPTGEANGEKTEWHTEGNQWIGARVRRSFGRGVVSYGKVVGWLPADENDGEELFHVKHDDGDEEDLDIVEVKKAVADCEANPPAEGGGAVAAAAAAQEPPEPLVLPEGASRSDHAVWTGLDVIAALAEEGANFALFGADVVQTFSDVAAVAPEPLRAKALSHVEAAAQRWKGRHDTLGDVAADKLRPRPAEVCDAIAGVYALERVGVNHPLKLECRKYVERHSIAATAIATEDGAQLPSSLYTVGDYLGYDPHHEQPLDVERGGEQSRCARRPQAPSRG